MTTQEKYELEMTLQYLDTNNIYQAVEDLRKVLARLIEEVEVDDK